MTSMFKRREQTKLGGLGTGGIILLFLVLLLIIIFAPFLTIWALNTIFPILAIQYSFWTWLAMMLLLNLQITGYFKLGRNDK